jgi:CubicO group peptidase (beta-lactamase class C family)
MGLGISKIVKASLEEYCQLNISGPLGITDTTFWPEKRPELNSRIARMAVRDPNAPDGQGKVLLYEGPSPGGEYAEEFGGHGIYGNMPDFDDLAPLAHR